MRVYLDGVFDIFHRGHLESIRQAKFKWKNTELIVGIVSDADCESYKRKPVFNEQDRFEIVSSIKWVDDVIFPCPLVVTKSFLDEFQIDMVVHSFSNEEDRLRQEPFFRECIELCKFTEIQYYPHISTTKLISTIHE